MMMMLEEREAKVQLFAEDLELLRYGNDSQGRVGLSVVLLRRCDDATVASLLPENESVLEMLEVLFRRSFGNVVVMENLVIVTQRMILPEQNFFNTFPKENSLVDSRSSSYLRKNIKLLNGVLDSAFENLRTLVQDICENETADEFSRNTLAYISLCNQLTILLTMAIHGGYRSSELRTDTKEIVQRCFQSKVIQIVPRLIELCLAVYWRIDDNSCRDIWSKVIPTHFLSIHHFSDADGVRMSSEIASILLRWCSSCEWPMQTPLERHMHSLKGLIKACPIIVLLVLTNIWQENSKGLFQFILAEDKTLGVNLALEILLSRCISLTGTAALIAHELQFGNSTETGIKILDETETSRANKLKFHILYGKKHVLEAPKMPSQNRETNETSQEKSPKQRLQQRTTTSITSQILVKLVGPNIYNIAKTLCMEFLFANAKATQSFNTCKQRQTKCNDVRESGCGKVCEMTRISHDYEQPTRPTKNRDDIVELNNDIICQISTASFRCLAVIASQAPAEDQEYREKVRDMLRCLSQESSLASVTRKSLQWVNSELSLDTGWFFSLPC